MANEPVRAQYLKPSVARPVRDGAADRLMRRLLRITTVDSKAGRGAHRAFRLALVISGVRCLITYLVIPIGVPMLSFIGVVAAPIGIVLCVYAIVNGVISVRRFWAADYRGKWMYTWFIAVVFIVLAFALVSDISYLAGQP